MKVTLLKGLLHNGKFLDRGDVVEIEDEAFAQRLVDKGTATTEDVEIEERKSAYQVAKEKSDARRAIDVAPSVHHKVAPTQQSPVQTEETAPSLTDAPEPETQPVTETAPQTTEHSPAEGQPTPEQVVEALQSSGELVDSSDNKNNTTEGA